MGERRGGGAAARLRGVRRVFEGGVVALDCVDLEVGAGEFVAVLGPSGCGKSTLLRVVAGLDRAQSGAVEVKVEPEDGSARIAFVFQDAHLLPWRTVLANVALPLELAGRDRRSRLRTAADAIEQVGLADAIDRYPAQLSGGMKMRVSLARALVTDPRLLLLDEPFAALDELTRLRLDEQLLGLWERRAMTVLFVTHSILEAALLARRAVVLSRRPARVVADLPIELPARRDAAMRTSAAFSASQERLRAALVEAEA